jgi:hypothetical protein
MSNKYELLQQNPQYCTRLFGIKFEQFESILEKVQQKEKEYLFKNPFLIEG